MPGLDPGILSLSTQKDRRIKSGDDDSESTPQILIMPGLDPGILFPCREKDA
jgi:hypothetical protein